MGPRSLWIAFGWLVSSLIVNPVVLGQSCESEAGFRELDFWLGDWDVYIGEQEVGTNRIEKILDGCAVLENWEDARGGEGKSLFYYHPVTEEWKQVWVTENATLPGGIKEKVLVERLSDGGVRFQGVIPVAGGSSYLDRTTLKPESDGSVRQVIERSIDGGKTWTVGFDAIYRPRFADL